MSAILSADDLNDFISPGVACIKPVETLPLQKPQDVEYAYEVTTEDAVSPQNHAPAQISLTDCLACSGCVTSAEAVLISLQSHSEALNSLDSYPSLFPSNPQDSRPSCGSLCNGKTLGCEDSRVFVASVSPQVRASLAATYGVSERRAAWMIEQLLSGPQGLASGGKYGNGFTWVIDTNSMREMALVMGADEVTSSLPSSSTTIQTGEQEPSSSTPRKPILTSACPGWICYAEKTHPHILPHLSRLKSPQALTGTFLKSILSQRLNISPDRIWHMAIMPCFDKKLEASRGELTDTAWRTLSAAPIRDVDCVITARELLMLADTRGISFPSLPQRPLPRSTRIPFPDAKFASFLFPHSKRTSQAPEAGTSGGYLHHILLTHQRLNPGSQILTTRGRNADVIEYSLLRPSSNDPILKAARYYGFRNIQNLVRKLRPPKQSRLLGARGLKAEAAAGKGMEYAYVEVMACPGGCTNGGGQIKGEDLGTVGGKEWLGRVDEAYFSADSDSVSSDSENDQTQPDSHDKSPEPDKHDDEINGIPPSSIREILQYWSSSTGIELEKLIYTTYRQVDSEVGKEKGGGVDRVVELAGKIGGGW